MPAPFLFDMSSLATLQLLASEKDLYPMQRTFSLSLKVSPQDIVNLLNQLNVSIKTHTTIVEKHV